MITCGGMVHTRLAHGEQRVERIGHRIDRVRALVDQNVDVERRQLVDLLRHAVFVALPAIHLE